MTKHEVIWFPFYLNDYQRDAAELSLAQHGAYLNLIRWYYATGQPIPNQPDRIYRRVGAFSAEERTSTDYVLAEYFVLDGPVWRHKRIDAELACVKARSEQGRRAAQKKWENRRENKKDNKINKSAHADASIEHMPEQCKSQSQSHTQPQSKSKSKPLAEVSSFPEWFPMQAWLHFVEERKRMRAPVTPRATELLIRELDKLRKQGSDPQEVIEQSIKSGWKGLFAVKGRNGQSLSFDNFNPDSGNLSSEIDMGEAERNEEN